MLLINIKSLICGIFNSIENMKLKSKITNHCKHCFTVQKKGRTYNYCRLDPRHKHRTRSRKRFSSVPDFNTSPNYMMWIFQDMKAVDADSIFGEDGLRAKRTECHDLN